MKQEENPRHAGVASICEREREHIRENITYERVEEEVEVMSRFVASG